jgi:AbrB family looped-hinge helix DNA binding protein
MHEMTAPVKMDKQGRVTIPPVIREELDLTEGEVVEITVKKMTEKNNQSRGQA